MKHALLALFLFSLSSSAFSQKVNSDTAFGKSADTLVIRESKFLNSNSEKIRYDSAFIWNDRRSLSEITAELPGVYIFRFNNFGRNTINFNGSPENQVGIFRDGIQINDVFFGGLDAASLSVNDIESIEEISAVSSFVYGVNSGAKSLNIVTKDKIQSKPFSQFRYSQDRFNSLFADVFFSLPFTKKYNLTMGITKHSVDGRYVNSQFDVWNGRSRFNVFFTKNLNLRADFYYNKIDRGLNEGLRLDSSTSALEDEDALVNNPYSNEEIEQLFFGATMTGRFFGKTSLTKLSINSSNSIRDYRNVIIDSSLVITGFTPSEKVHYISNSIQLSQEGYVRFSKVLNLKIFGLVTAYQNLYDRQVVYDKERVQLSFKADLNHKVFSLSVFGSNPLSDITIENLNKGVEVSAIPLNSKSTQLKIFAGINETTTPAYSYDPFTVRKSYIEAGLSFSYMRAISLKQTFYRSSPSYFEGTSSSYNNQTYNGLNTDLNVNAYNIFADITYGYSESLLFPEHNLIFDLSYRNFLFKKKLNLHSGFRGSYVRKRDRDLIYDQRKNEFASGEAASYDRDEFNLDFYVGARIGRANVNLTLANILNTFTYGAYLYPSDNRGGFVNSISRFTIVWDFID
ncbi:MAG: TonB-dependent receptor plug domain-containing protein [Ignavibacteria bacterium]|nr:TonB-dependent receptor plug domain-containing protein [Ignavibacteria bacterium]